MYDSVTAGHIPRTAQMVAGYMDGAYKWSDADWELFPRAVLVGITVTGQTLAADVADVERGDLTPAQGAAWLKRKKAAGQLGCLYFSRSLLSTVVTEVRKLGIRPEDWTIWEADWTGIPHFRDGAFAVQYDHPPHSGGHYDLSVVADYWPGIDPKPAPAPGPKPGPAPGPPSPPSPGPVPPPPGPPPPGPPPADAGAAQRSFWELVANILGHGIPRLLREILDQVRHLKDI